MSKQWGKDGANSVVNGLRLQYEESSAIVKRYLDEYGADGIPSQLVPEFKDAVKRRDAADYRLDVLSGGMARFSDARKYEMKVAADLGPLPAGDHGVREVAALLEDDPDEYKKFVVETDNGMLVRYLAGAGLTQADQERQNYWKRVYGSTEEAVATSLQHTGDPGSTIILPERQMRQFFREAQNEYDILRLFPQYYTADGRTQLFPVDTTTNPMGKYIREGQAATMYNQGFTSVKENVFKITSGAIAMSTEMIRDSIIDYVSFTLRGINERLNNLIAHQVTNGRGEGYEEVLGYLNVRVPDSNIIKVSGEGTTLGLTYSAINQLIHALHSTKSAGATLVMHPDVHKALLEIMDGTGNPMFRDLRSNGGMSDPPQILGRRIVYNSWAPVPGPGAPIISFINFRDFRLRYVGGMRIMRILEALALTDTRALIAYLTFGCGYFANPQHGVSHIWADGESSGPDLSAEHETTPVPRPHVPEPSHQIPAGKGKGGDGKPKAVMLD